MDSRHFTALGALKLLAPPPSHPKEAGKVWAWPKMEHRLESALPQDYRSFIQAYGTGCLGRFLWVFNPFSKRADLNLVDRSRNPLDSRGRHLDPFAADEGLLLWGCTDDGHRLYWRRVGQPDGWPVVVWSPDGPDHQVYTISMSEFLYGWLQTDIICRLFPARPFKAIFEIHPYRPADAVRAAQA